MEDYDKELKKNNKRNEKYLSEFEKWLRDKKLVNKTIEKHLSNVEFYLNTYLNYYEVTKMEEGIYEVYRFLDDWFIRKCMWSSETSLREMATSIKKFYQCMSELKHIEIEDYKELSMEIKENMPHFLESLYEYDNMDCGWF